jgi:hypothetical protein
MSNKLKIKKRESKESKIVRDMITDIFEQAVEVIDTVEPIVVLSYDGYTINIDLCDTLPELRQRMEEGLKAFALGNKSRILRVAETYDEFAKMDLTDVALLVCNELMGKIYESASAYSPTTQKGYTLVAPIQSERC